MLQGYRRLLDDAVTDDRARDLLERIEEIRVVRLRPGDVVVARSAVALDQEDSREIAEALKSLFPDNKCILLAGGIDIEVVRPEGSEVAVPVDGTFERP